MRVVGIIVLIAALIMGSLVVYAEDLFREGLLGAGAGAVGGLASGAKGKNVWKGALAGMGVTIIGGALFDSMSGKKVANVDQVQSMSSQDAFKQGYESGFQNGFREGYQHGYQEGVQEPFGK